MPTQLSAIIRNGKIEPLEPIDLPEGTQVIVTLDDSEAVELSAISLQGLNRAYGDDEPEYDMSQLKELNPSYEGR